MNISYETHKIFEIAIKENWIITNTNFNQLSLFTEKIKRDVFKNEFRDILIKHNLYSLKKFDDFYTDVLDLCFFKNEKKGE